MAKGRGSAMGMVVVVVVVMVCVMLQAEHSEAVVYTVNGSGGWTFNVAGWPKGKRFRAGDVLVFNYDPTIHNVVAVDRGGYNNCRAPPRAKIFKSGKDRITLTKGPNFFICSFPGHCESAMKISVTAA